VRLTAIHLQDGAVYHSQQMSVERKKQVEHGIEKGRPRSLSRIAMRSRLQPLAFSHEPLAQFANERVEHSLDLVDLGVEFSIWRIV